MRRTAGIVLGLSVVGCQGMQLTPPAKENEVMAHLIQVPVQTGMAPAPAAPMNPQAGPPVGTAYGPQYQYLPQQMPQQMSQQMPQQMAQPGEPPFAPQGPSAMYPGDPNQAARQFAMNAPRGMQQAGGMMPGAEDPAMKNLQMELTKEMCQQIMQLRQKVQELSAATEAHAEASPSRVKTAAVAKADPAPTVTPASASIAVPAAPAIPAPPVMNAEEMATRALQLEVTRELGHQVVDLKQKVQELRGDIETWAEKGREKQAKQAQAEVQDLRLQIAKLQSEMTKLKTPEKAPAPPKAFPATDATTPGLSEDEPAPIVPLLPTRTKRPAVREGSAVQQQKEANRRFADALSAIRSDLDELKSSFLLKMAHANDAESEVAVQSDE